MEDDTTANDQDPLEQQTVFKNVSEAIPTFGGFGMFQKLLTACFCVMIIPSTFCNLIMYFAALNPSWKCTENSTVCQTNATFPSFDSSRCTMNRSDWQFTEPPSFSIVTYFDLYCEKEWMIHLTSSMVFIGWGFGAVILGWLSDNYGRKIVLFPSFLGILLIGFLSIYSPGIALFVVSRFVVGFFKPGTSVVSVVLLSEYVNTKYRPHSVCLVWMFFAVGLCLLSLKAYFLRDWKILFIACTVPYVFVFAFYKFIPESVRWFHLNKNTDQITKIFERISYWNKKKIPKGFKILPVEESTNGHHSNPLVLFKTKKMAIRSLVQGYIWLVNGMVYYGLSMAADDLGGSLYANFALLSIIEFPANLLGMWLSDRIGRKKTICFNMAIGGVTCVICAFIPSIGGIKILRIILGTFGKFCITISFNIVYTWSMEIYTTDVRAEGMGWLQITSRIGSASASWVAKGLKAVHHVTPFIVMGSLAVIGSVLSLLLPETKGKPMKDVFNDEDEIDKEELTKDVEM